MSVTGRKLVQGPEVWEKLEMTIEWMAENKHVDDSYVQSLYDYCERFSGLTERQYEALENIIERFRIE